MQEANQNCTWKLSINEDVYSMTCWLNNKSGEFSSTQEGFRWTNVDAAGTLEKEY